MLKLGIVVDNLSISQLSYFLIKNINSLITTRNDIDPIIFYENLHKPCISPMFAIMHTNELWGFEGTVISTSLSTTSKLLNTCSDQKQLFYVWDLEWTRCPRQYESIINLYRSVPLIVRNIEHKQILEKCWNVNVSYIMDNFNIENCVPCLI